MQVSKMTYEDYTTIMWRLSDRKQDAERIWRDVQALEEWIPGLEGMRSLGKRIEDYLEALETEWERVAAAPEKFSIELLTELKEFQAKFGSGEPSTS